jgi:hypothetical protein
MPNENKPKKVMKKTGNGKFEQTITREEKHVINKDMLLREKTSLENRLKEINEDLAEVDKLDKEQPDKPTEDPKEEKP